MAGTRAAIDANRFRGILGGLAFLPGAGFMTLALAADWMKSGPPGPSVDQFAYAALGLIAILAGLSIHRIPPPVALLLGCVSNGLLVIALVASLRGLVLGSPPPKSISIINGLTSQPMFQKDELYGYRPSPKACAEQIKDEFKVTYTTDSRGWRTTPNPRFPLGRITIAGCSFAFGLGVEDDENFPALLGSKYWPRFRVKNMSCPGWGTAQAYFALIDEAKSRKPPDLFIYCWIADHRLRNYFYPGSIDVQTFTFGDITLPHFEVENGRLIHMGLGGSELASGRSTNELYPIEVEITKKLLEAMAENARTAGIPFVVALLPRRDPPGHFDIVKFLKEKKIPYVDMLKLGVEFYPIDGHPTPKGHAAIAAAMAKDERLRAALGRIRLGRP